MSSTTNEKESHVKKVDSDEEKNKYELCVFHVKTTYVEEMGSKHSRQFSLYVLGSNLNSESPLGCEFVDSSRYYYVTFFQTEVTVLIVRLNIS